MTSRILALDTTSPHGSLALLTGEAVVEQVSLRSADGFGHVLFPELESLLARNGWDLRTVDCFAGAAGPGSFTGIRVGLAAVKGLAEALGRPAIAVSNLQAIAWHGRAPLRAALIDARRGEVYGAVYSSSLGIVQAETVTGLRDWLDGLPTGETEILATDLSPFLSELTRYPRLTAQAREAPRALAGAVGAIAGRLMASGVRPEPVSLDGNYVRRSDAELFWRDWQSPFQ